MISSRLTRRDSLLFVYGTLRPFADIEMAKWLRSNACYLGSATTPGRLYDLGSYPGMRAARSPRERVIGDVYRITNARVFRVLDRYEERFARERCVVSLARGGRKIAWAYRYRYRVASAARIASGDYRIHREMGTGQSCAGNGDGLIFAREMGTDLFSRGMREMGTGKWGRTYFRGEWGQICFRRSPINKSVPF